MALFQSFWNGKLGPLQALCIQSFLDHGHEFDLYAFNQMANVPRGARTLDAKQIIRNSSWWRNHEQLRSFSNLFRYELLKQKGGWWVDTDVVCLTDKVADCNRFFAWVDSEVINTAILYFRPDDSLLDDCIKRWKRCDDADRSGPRLFTELLRETGESNQAQPAATCYPIHWKEAEIIFKPARTTELKERIKMSAFLHLWDTIFHWHKVDMTKRPPAGSLLGDFALKHGWIN